MIKEPKSGQQAVVLWQIRFDGVIASAPLALADGVVVALKRANGTSLSRLNLNEGRICWEYPCPAALATDLVRTGHQVCTTLKNQDFVRLNVHDGQPVASAWQLGGTPIGPIHARYGQVTIRTKDLGGYALESFSGSEAWRVDDPSDGAADTRLVSSQDTLLVVASPGGQVSVTALNRKTGRTIWQQSELATGPVVDLWHIGGLVDIVTASDGVVGLHHDSGEPRPRRFQDQRYESITLAGSSALLMTSTSGTPLVLCSDAVVETVTGRSGRPVDRVVGASASEVLVMTRQGRPAMYALPDMKAITLPQDTLIGKTQGVAWARDVAYLVSENRQTLTALDLGLSETESDIASA